MTEAQANTRAKRRIRWRVLGPAALIVIGVLVSIWITACPCATIPGFLLSGDVQEAPVTDWSFANDIPLCQIQVYAGSIPHSVNLNCMATPEGELFLSCGGCADKFWGRQVGENERGRVRLDGRVYPVVLTRIVDEAVLDRAWAARAKKLQVHGGMTNPAPPPGAKRPEGWQTFQLRSAVG